MTATDQTTGTVTLTNGPSGHVLTLHHDPTRPASHTGTCQCGAWASTRHRFPSDVQGEHRTHRRTVVLVTDNGRGSFHRFTIPSGTVLAHGYAYATRQAAVRRGVLDRDATVITSTDTDRPPAFAVVTSPPEKG